MRWSICAAATTGPICCRRLALCFFPLNPVLLWVERRLCAERELACDDRVLRSSGARKAYATCLTRLAEYSMLRRSLSLVLGAWERQSELVRRVHRILRRPHESMSGRQATFVTGSLILGVLAGAIVLARSPQLVSFAPLAQSTAAGSLDTGHAALTQMDLREFGGSPSLVKAVMPERPFQSHMPAKHRCEYAAKQSVKRDQRSRADQAGSGLC